MRTRIQRFCTQTLCLLLAASIVVPAWGAPGDVMTSSPAPTIGADPPKARDIKVGDASVSTQTGALQYSYPITVPPGRNGVQPSLALSYSSQSHIYGGIASGWSLSVPEIRLDLSISPLKQLYYGPTAWDQQHFVSSLSGSRPLVAVVEPKGSDAHAAFRAQNDSSYLRYERMNEGQPYLWRARATDGTTYYFGDTSLSWGWDQPYRVPLTRTVDTFGNTVEYEWEGTELQEIRYTSNPAAGLPAFARVEFGYLLDSCATRLPPGAADDLRIDSVDGYRRLTKIRTIAFDPATGTTQHTREYTLGYDAQASDCSGGTHGLIRQLTSIQESAWGPSAPRVDLPPVKFEYNRLARTFDRVQIESPNWFPASGTVVTSSSSGIRTQGQWSAVRSMLLDFDGDALPDKIMRAEDPEHPNECAFIWQKNLGRGPDGKIQFDGPSDPQIMPRLPWETGQRTYPEECALNFQRTKFRNVPWGMVPGGCGTEDANLGSYLVYRWLDVTGDGRVDLVAAINHSFHLNPNEIALNPELRVGASQWPSCGPVPPPKPVIALRADCAQSATICGDKDGCGFDRDELDTCIAEGTPANSEQICREQTAGEEFEQWALNNRPLPPVWQPGDPPPPQPVPQTCDYARPQMLCDRSPWFVYENQGGVLAQTGVIKYQLAHLESDKGDSALGGGSGFSSEDHAIQDLDGDGHVDLVVRGISPDTGLFRYWNVFPGDGQGGFEKNGDWPYMWFVPDGAQPSKSGIGCFGHSEGNCANNAIGKDDYATNTWQMLADLNGDGAADYFRGQGPDDADVFYGAGYKFRTWSPTDGEPLPHVRGSLSRSWSSTTDAGPSGWLRAGDRWAMTRLVDVDADGRSDLIQSWPVDFDAYYDWINGEPQWSPPTLHINAGGQFLQGFSLNENPNLERALVQQTTAVYVSDPLTSQSQSFWATSRDLIDMDGDGLPEHWNFLAASHPPAPEPAQIPTYLDTSDQPLRLLRKIDNGIGGTVEVLYAPTTKASVVVQDAELGKAMPRSQWVVESMSVKDAFDPDVADVATTTYTYKYPVWNQDDRGQWGFRGFEEVTTTRPSDARVVDIYGFDVDWSGRLKSSKVFSEEQNPDLLAAPDKPSTINDTTWQAYTLFGGAITTYHPYRTQSWTCNNGQTEAQCRGANDGVVTYSTWIPLSSSLVSGGPALAYVERQKSIRDSLYAFDTGDRATWEEYYFYADEDDYRLWHKEHQAMEMTPQGVQRYERWRLAFDALYRAPIARFVPTFEGEANADVPSTVWNIDWTTGVKEGTRSPDNYPSGPLETYQYDPTKRFVTRTTNELGHVVDRTYDPGTGAVLTARGPTSASCGGGCNAPMSWTDTDGLGRPLATWVNVEVPGNPAWQKTQTSRTTYTDHVVSGAPTKVITESRIEYDQNRWTREETHVDGQARPRMVRVKTGLGPDAVTTYDYDRRGNLVSVTLPDPSVANPTTTPTPTVTYTYDFDSLGRPISMRRPAMVGAASGVDITYDGRVHDIEEVAGGEGGPAARKVLVHDIYGRLTEVREYTDVTAGTFATTTYAYDGRDIVKRIQDPNGVVTELFHDYHGRRTSIVRGGRTWQYTYWKGGQLKSEAAPPPSPAQALDYTTTFAYDVTGRPTSRNVGGRDLSVADQALFGVGTISFEHDTCFNGLGRLCLVQFPDQVLKVSYSYDAEGNPTSEKRTFQFAGVTGTREMSSTYGPGGRVREHVYADQDGGANATRSSVEYDDRGLPTNLWWHPSSGGVQLVAAQTRNLAGLVTKREARDAADPLAPELATDFTYDKLTRVRSQTVRHLASFTQLAKQELDYFGQDDPSDLRHWLGAEYYDFDYRYDSRHQLISVKEPRFSANYSFHNSGKLDRATVQAYSAPGSDVVNRDVKYIYGSPIDPDAVSALHELSSGTSLRSYTYDTAGGMVTREGGASSESFAYDGEDQLRRATVGDLHEEYFYDHGGNRAAVVTRNSAGTVTNVRVFIGDTELVLKDTGALEKSYAHLSLGTPVARITDRKDLELQYHGLSSNTLLAVEPDGTVNAGFVYAPYGELLFSTGSGVAEQHRRFNDKFQDDLTSLNYYGVRYYDSLLLGWTQADPQYRFQPDAAWIEPRRAALYSFCLLNPARYIDPDGKDSVAGTAWKVWLTVNTYNPVHYGVRSTLRVPAMVRGETSALKAQAADTIRMGAALLPGGGLRGAATQVAAAGTAMYIETGSTKAAGVAMGMTLASYGIAAATNGVVAGAISRTVADSADDAGRAASLVRQDKLKPGPFAKESIPGHRGRPTAQEQREVNELMKKHGCHHCGTNDPGTKSGNAVADHQPPQKLAEPTKFFPHCLSCAREQGGQTLQELLKQKKANIQ
ncbi:MAG TPA: toxin TcdB middle/N-terminal domain-containing protein [Vicinamibacterales bacterium]|nr:toxin TcdB middle/N-terminal domain-containing protein [Vicinamibacterales bacterium]